VSTNVLALMQSRTINAMPAVKMKALVGERVVHGAGGGNRTRDSCLEGKRVITLEPATPAHF
jgi:hypothetical protein